MELPPLVKLKSLMVKEGYAIDDNAMSIEEMAEGIAKAVGASKHG